MIIFKISETKKNKLKLGYEVIFIVLSFIAVSIAFLDIIEKINLDASPGLLLFDTAITYVFILDYVIRLMSLLPLWDMVIFLL